MLEGIGKWWEEIVERVMASIIDCLRGMIITNLEQSFANFNGNLDKFTKSLSKTPETFNGSAYGMVTKLAENAMLPIGIVILAFIFVTELYEFVKDMNSGMGNFNQSKFFELLGITAIILFIINHATDIVLEVFRIGAKAAQNATASASVTIPDGLWNSITTEEDIGVLISAVVTSFIIKLSMYVINVALVLCMYIRMFEIYIYMCAAPAPLATLQSKDWGETGKNYIRAILALSLQAFFMLAIVAIFGAVLGGMDTSGDLDSALLECLAFCALVVLMLFKAGNISKSIFNAH